MFLYSGGDWWREDGGGGYEVKGRGCLTIYLFTAAIDDFVEVPSSYDESLLKADHIDSNEEYRVFNSAKLAINCLSLWISTVPPGMKYFLKAVTPRTPPTLTCDILMPYYQ